MTGSLDLRIMMTTDAVGGVWTYATSLAAALAAAGAEITLVSIGPSPRPDQRAMLPDDVRLIETGLALEWQDPQGADLANARQVLGDIEGSLRPDIVHLNSFREATFEWRSKVIVVAHSCVRSWAVTCNDSAWLDEPRWQAYGKLVATGLNAADAWACPSRAHHDLIRDLYHPGRPGTVIWNGIADRANALPEKEPLVLAAGRLWDKAKNLATLVAAAEGLAWPVLVAGPGGVSDGQEYRRIELLGDLPHHELQSRMERAAIFASPARYEPFGLSVLEAASAGCALVLADIGSFRELWDDAALFVPAADASAWRDALNLLIQDEAMRAHLQRTAFERSRRYSLARMAGQYMALYGEVTRARRGSDSLLATGASA